ncbi:nuclear transport factor 2 family protein [Flavitalea sp. BT771]|uniref:YybH family protein n=1 Tax=Flavitalea sp. BT771 TaxID=3063329 RepID=UPI0026E44ED4|nr:nuclear transport factor 2 family protein [Flavitalea sp. BT771]MDO6434821.1 nuclear transport factor 2 family protein [Flavitalea sp. BT771]MDV6223721.1 nuclear transport factor 2 family protein [Flavitalea sp. BT771]
MKKITTIGTLLTLTLPLILQAQAKLPETDIQSITRVNKQYGEAFAKNDSTLFLDCYTSDACLLAPNAPALCGEKRLQVFYRAAYNTGMRNIVFTTANWYGYTGDYVTEQGTYQQFDANNTPIGTGKYLVVWQKLANGWKMLRDMFNADSLTRTPSGS